MMVLSDPENVGTTSGITPYDGSRMLTVSESPIDGTPQAFIAWVTNISAGDEIIACYYGYDNTPNASPSLRTLTEAAITSKSTPTSKRVP